VVDAVAMSQPVFDEILDVLNRPRLKRFLDPDLCLDVLDHLRSGTAWFDCAEQVTDCRDPADNKYLELALASHAGVIVSSDRDLLALHPWRGREILSPGDYLGRR
jgi:putative PIN family toxin of toxin-antitoxin system